MTPVSYWNSKNELIRRFCPTCGIQQKATAVPTAITNRTSRGSSTVQLLQLCVCVCVCETALGFVYIMLCTDNIQVTGNPLSLMHFCVQRNTDLWFRELY